MRAEGRRHICQNLLNQEVYWYKRDHGLEDRRLVKINIRRKLTTQHAGWIFGIDRFGFRFTKKIQYAENHGRGLFLWGGA